MKYNDKIHQTTPTRLTENFANVSANTNAPLSVVPILSYAPGTLVEGANISVKWWSRPSRERMPSAGFQLPMYRAKTL